MNSAPNSRRTEPLTGAEPATASASAPAGTEQPGASKNKPLRSGDLDPAIRSAPQAARPSRDEEIRILRSLPYEQYLLTAWWRGVRNRILKLAGYQCSRCQVTRGLEVHHKTYDRVGDELDADLEVLCRGCHLGLHVNEIQHGLGVYMKLVSESIQAGDFTMLAELIEDVKCRCARAKIPYGDGQVHAAIARMDNRLTAFMPKKFAALLHEGLDDAPMTHAEACGWMVQLGALVKPMPDVPMRLNQREHDSIVVIRKLKAAALDSARRCRDLERIAAEAEIAAVQAEGA